MFASVISWSRPFFNTSVSQGSVETRLTFDGIVIDHVTENLLLSLPVKEFWQELSSVAEMGDRLATIDMGRKVGVLCAFPWGSWVPI